MQQEDIQKKKKQEKRMRLEREERLGSELEKNLGSNTLTTILKTVFLSEKEKQKIGVCTYNQIGTGEEYVNGIVSAGDKEIHILQQALRDGKSWYETEEIQELKEKDVKRYEQLKGELTKSSTFSDVKEFDHLVAYIGRSNTENMLKETEKIDDDKIIYVFCGCGEDRTERLLDKLRRGRNRIRSECGGNKTLEKITDILTGNYITNPRWTVEQRDTVNEGLEIVNKYKQERSHA